MASDLTERLAAKLGTWTLWLGHERLLRLDTVAMWHPLLLSEPELVAGLPMETKVALTCQLLGDGDLRLSVLTPRERAVMKLGEATLALHAASDEQFGAALAKRDIAVIEALRALVPPSPAPMEGRSNE